MDKLAKIRVGTSALTKDIVWCECVRGISMSGMWLFCPTCGKLIDQNSYADAVEQALKNGAALYVNAEAIDLRAKLTVAEERRDHFYDGCCKWQIRAVKAEESLREIGQNLAASEAYVRLLREALEHYAEQKNWKCRRCGRHDSINCFNSMYGGPVNTEDGQP